MTATTVVVSGHTAGQATITVTARDPGGLTAAQSFNVTVEPPPNRAPYVLRGIYDIRHTAPGDTRSASLSRVFIDSDGDQLTYTSSSSNSTVATANIASQTISVNALAVGSATITVTATDPRGLSASDQFDVTVETARFTIELAFTSNVAEGYRSVFRQARDTWESVLDDTELGDVNLPSQIACLGLGASDLPTLDDHLTLADISYIDGAYGILARATYCYSRLSDGTPVVSAMVFDSYDIARMQREGTLDEVVLHELAHGLGFHHAYFDDFGLINEGSDPYFSGDLATEAFDSAGGTNYAHNKVPISEDHSHWRESVFGNELMSPYLGTGAIPFSTITIQAMADVGYHVDLSQADTYQLPTSEPPPGVPHEEVGAVVDLRNDFVRVPVVVIGEEGQTVRVIPAPPGASTPSFPLREVHLDRRGVRIGPGGRRAPAGGTMWRRVSRPGSGGRPM